MGKKLFIIIILFVLFFVNTNSYSQIELEKANFIASKGIIELSRNPYNYRLGDSITRKEMMKIIMNLYGIDVPNVCNLMFSDVTNDWGCKYIEKALALGFISKNTYFRPNDNITRIEVIKLILKVKGIKKIHETINWQRDYMKIAYKEGIIDKKYTDYNTVVTRGWTFYAIANAIKNSNNSQNTQGSCGDGVCNSIEKSNKNLCNQDCNTSTTTTKELPYYFIAIHNEPFPDSRYPSLTLESNYLTLKKIIQKADEYNIKLTLMFTAQWADYILESSERIKDLESWKKQGHEIAAHHHEITHTLWDGYSNSSEEEIKSVREKKNAKKGLNTYESYNGTMDDYMNKLKKINPKIVSGCMNGDNRSIVMPDEIIYSTCGNFVNSGDLNQIIKDTDSKKGVNDYITVAKVNGITRKYLSHSQISNEILRTESENIIKKMTSKEVYGAVGHSIEDNMATGNHDESNNIIKFLEFIHKSDPNGTKSKTLSEIIEQKLLPEKTISEDLINNLKQNSDNMQKKFQIFDY